MPGLIETDSFTANLTGSVVVGSYTAAVAGWVSSRLRLSGLNTAGRQTITASLIINDGINDNPAERASGIKAAAGDTRFQRTLPAVWLSPGDTLKVSVTSSSASDTSVPGSVSFIDAGNPTAAVETDAASRTASKADLTGLALEATSQAVKAKTDNLPASPAAVGSAMTLADGAITAAKIAANAITASVLASNAIGADQLSAAAVAKIEAALLDEGDGQQLVDAIVQAIGNSNVDEAALVVAIKAALFDAGSTANKIAVNGAGQVQASNVATPPTASQIKDALEADGSKLDHVWDLTEDDGGTRRLTANALALAPTGGTAPTVEAIRAEIDANSTQLAALLADTGTDLPGLIAALQGIVEQIPRKGQAYQVTDAGGASKTLTMSDPA